MEMIDYLIIGNGITGLSAAEEVRKRDGTGRIMMISSEELPTYYRVKLSHYISKEFDRESLLVHDWKWYEDRQIELLLSSAVEQIDFHDKTVKSEKGSFRYEKLLLANGSHPFIPPAKGLELEGVFSLRTVNDLERIQSYLSGVEKVAVVGGGILGLEAAWAIHELGKEVAIVEYAPFLMNRQLDEPVSRDLEKMLCNNGFSMYLGAGAAEIIGKGNVQSVKLTDNRVMETDAILYSCGIRSNTDLFQGTPLTVERGIVTNGNFETSIEDVYAAGDVAQINGITLGLWTAGMAQGKIAGANMAGEKKVYELEMPSTVFQINDWKIFSTGIISDKLHSIESTLDQGRLKLFFEKGYLKGGILLDNTKLLMDLKKLVKEMPDCSDFLIKGIDAEKLLNELKNN